MNNRIINEKNKETNEPKKIFLKCAKNNNNKNNINGNNINTIKSYNGPKSNKINIKNNKEIKEKTEKILNLIKTNKKDEKQLKMKIANEKNKLNNILEKKNKYPIISQMPKLPVENKADRMINQIFHKNRANNLQNKNININRDNFNFNFGNEKKNINNQIMNNNYLKKMPIVKPANNLPNITYGKNNQIKIEYGVVKYKSTKHKIKRK